MAMLLYSANVCLGTTSSDHGMHCHMIVRSDFMPEGAIYV